MRILKRPPSCAMKRSALQNEIAQRRKEWEQRREGRVEIVGEEEVAQIVSSWTGIPVSRMTEGEAERLLHLEETLAQSRDRAG